MPAPQESGEPAFVFDPGLHVSPYTFFRRLKEGHRPRLLDVRPEACGGPGVSFAGALPVPDPAWNPRRDEDVVLFDDDGALAAAFARRYQAAGFASVRALFGGLRLYDFALDPRVVGEERFLRSTGV